MQDKVRTGALSLRTAKGEVNPADLFTKYLDQGAITKCLGFLAVRQASGRPCAAPRLAAEVEAFLARVTRPSGLADGASRHADPGCQQRGGAARGSRAAQATTRVPG